MITFSLPAITVSPANILQAQVDDIDNLDIEALANSDFWCPWPPAPVWHDQQVVASSRTETDDRLVWAETPPLVLRMDDPA